MKIEIEIEDKYVTAVASQCLLVADSKKDEQYVEDAQNKCLSETIKIDPKEMGEDSKQLQLALAMIAIGACVEELKEKEKN